MKTILLWDARFPDRRPVRLTVEDSVASAAVRAGVAAAADPAEAGVLSAGGALDPSMLTEVVIQDGSRGGTRRVFLPYSVVIIGAAAGVMASIGTPIPGSVTPTPTPTPTLALSPASPSVPVTAAAGTLVSNIANVPPGVTPSVTPNDGRLVVAGDASSGWKVVVGMTAMSAGQINFAVAAAGAAGVSGTLTLTASPIIRIVPLLGQSNIAGRGVFDATLDANQANVKQWPTIQGNAVYRTIRDSTQPLYHPEDRVSQNLVGPGQRIGKTIANTLTNGEIVLLVPCAWGGTSLVSSSANSAPNAPQWAVGRSLYEAAITEINAAITYAKTLNPASSIHSIHFGLGETDASDGISQAAFYTPLAALIADARSRIIGASDATPFIIQGFVPENADLGYAAIYAAHRQAALNLTNVSHVVGPYGQVLSDNLHYTGVGERQIGTLMGQAALGTHSVAFDKITYNMTEGDSGTKTLTVSASRSTKVGAATATVTFNPGSTSTDDFAGNVYPSGLQFVWADGQTIASYSINFNGDTTVENNESFTQTLAAPAGYVLGTRTTATGTILNDDTSAGAGQNLIGSPNDFDLWAQTGVTVTPNVEANPVGDKAVNAERITDTASNNNHGLVPPAGVVGSINQGQTYTHAVDIKTETQPFAQIFLSSTGRFTINDWANFDLVAGTVSAKGSSAIASVIDLGNGWKRCILTATATGSGDPVFTVRGATVGTLGRNTGYVGDGKSMLIANAQIVVGTAANAFPAS